MKKEIRNDNRRRRVRHHLKTVAFNGEKRPRLSIFRSHTHIYAQIIDDMKGQTIASASSMDKTLRKDVTKGGALAGAAAIGAELAKRAMAAGVKTVYFDRGEFRYHGRIKALADAARAQGLQF